MPGESLSRDERSLGPYEILREIGRGASAAVYEARDRATGERVALKVLWERHALSAEAIERFEQEAKILRALNHPRIVASRSTLLKDRGRCFFAMEFVEGKTLDALLKERGSLPAHGAVQIVLQVLQGLDVAHWAGVLHRDLKPANVLLRRGDAEVLVRLTDFGVAAATSTQALSESGELLGTASYLPPEVCRGEGATAASDLYAVGAILYEALEGRPPFVADSLLSVMRAHLEDPVPPFSVQEGKDAPALHRIVERAMAKDPDERYASAKEMAQDLLALASARQTASWDPLWNEAAESCGGIAVSKEAQRIVEDLGETVLCHACGSPTQEGLERCGTCKARVAESLFPRHCARWEAVEKALSGAAAGLGAAGAILPAKAAAAALALAAVALLDAWLYLARAYGRPTALEVRRRFLGHLGRTAFLSAALGLAAAALAAKAFSGWNGSLRIVPWIGSVGWLVGLAMHWAVARGPLALRLDAARKRSLAGWSVEGSSEAVSIAELANAASAGILKAETRVSGPQTQGHSVRADRVAALAKAFGRCHVCAAQVPRGPGSPLCPHCRSPLFWVDPEGWGLPRWVFRPAALSFLKLQAFALVAGLVLYAAWTRWASVQLPR